MLKDIITSTLKEGPAQDYMLILRVYARAKKANAAGDTAEFDIRFREALEELLRSREIEKDINGFYSLRLC